MTAGAVLRIDNKSARRLWLHTQGLASAPTGRVDLPALVKHLGFVQLDTIRVVARAHDHILWSRAQGYREHDFDRLLRSRAVFEHFTHDASVLPIEFYPYWRRQFRRKEKAVRKWVMRDGRVDEAEIAAVKARVQDEGPLSTHAFDSKTEKRAVWSRPPHKMALDYLWYAGHLATSHRKNFIKFYDLTERVIPAVLRTRDEPDEACIDWLCEAALARLGCGSEGDIQRFWEAASRTEVKAWAQRHRAMLRDVQIETADGRTYGALAPLDIETRLAVAPEPTSRLRILNPFDPAVRDRTRLARLFGFDYRIEIFTPAARRQYGYYVYPLLEGNRFVGRMEVRADRRAGRLEPLKLWPEPGVRWGKDRQRKLAGELERLSRFVDCREVGAVPVPR